MIDIVERLKYDAPSEGLQQDALTEIESLRQQINAAEANCQCELIKLEQQLAESDTNTLRLIETIKYLVGIAERGEERKQLDDETAEQFVLGYMKRIEKQLAECQAREKQAKREALLEAALYVKADTRSREYAMDGLRRMAEELK